MILTENLKSKVKEWSLDPRAKEVADLHQMFQKFKYPEENKMKAN